MSNSLINHAALMAAQQSLTELYLPVDKVTTSDVNVLLIAVDDSTSVPAADSMRVKDAINEIAKKLPKAKISSDTFIAVYALNKGVLRQFSLAEEFVPLTEAEMIPTGRFTPLFHGITHCAEQSLLNRFNLELPGHEVRTALFCYTDGEENIKPPDPRFTTLENVQDKVEKFLNASPKSAIAGVGIGDSAAGEFRKMGFPTDSIHSVNSVDELVEILLRFSQLIFDGPG